ncbi:MAG: hypothetical protein AB7S69_10505 [Salinivirgaceae bacterium]
MKNLNVFFLVAATLSVLIFSSCEEADPVVTETDTVLASEVIGTYIGTLKSSQTNQIKEATITVTMQNDSLVMMHCMAENFDSTFIMQLYQNHDSIMVCYTGQDFYNEYGHNTNNYDFCNNQPSGWTNDNWMNDDNCWGNNNTNWGNSAWAGNDQWNAWTNHMNTQHNQNDSHYGGFDPTKNSCFYEFSMYNNNTEYFELFEGVKQ